MNRDSLDPLRDQILTAFASASPSDPADLINLPQPDDEEDRHIELELAGKPWADLNQEFLLKWWPSFGSLLPASYRYYLQALLVHCLEDLSEENQLMSGTLMILTPGFYRLYHYGQDRRFEYQTSLITSEQHAAICSFLGLLLTLPRWKYRSAQALKFGWKRIEHPALIKCREFYDELHHYAYPVIDDPEQRQLIEAIRDAFDARPYPGDDRLCGSDQGDEPAEYALEFRGLDWRTLHPDFLAYHYAALSFFSDEGFAFFLPAFMIADVLGQAGNADPVFHLTYGLYEEGPPPVIQFDVDMLRKLGLDPEQIALLQSSPPLPSKTDWHAYIIRRCAGFGLQEREVIVRYLEYSAGRAWEDQARKIHEALESYWKPSLTQL